MTTGVRPMRVGGGSSKMYIICIYYIHIYVHVNGGSDNDDDDDDDGRHGWRDRYGRRYAHKPCVRRARRRPQGLRTLHYNITGDLASAASRQTGDRRHVETPPDTVSPSHKP